MPQKISTPSVINIRDEVILATTSRSNIGVTARDPWDQVLTTLEPLALDTNTVIAGMDASTLPPSSSNPFVTKDEYDTRLGIRFAKVIGPSGAGADFNGDDEVPFVDCIASMPSGGTIIVLPGTYTFNSNVFVTQGIEVQGVHWEEVLITGASNTGLFNLSDPKASLYNLTLENPNAIAYPLVIASGEGSYARVCKFQGFKVAAMGLTGERAKAEWCRVESSETGALGLILSGKNSQVMNCSFAGTLPGGAVQVGGNETRVIASYFASSLTGPSFLIPSPAIHDTAIVSCHFDSPSSLSASTDNGTGSVRYANTPNSFDSNQNNLLVPLKHYTGQPLLTSSSAILGPTGIAPSFSSSSYTLDTSGSDHDLTRILGSLDKFIQWSYEDRNVFLTSLDPTFNPITGSCTGGSFSWDGTTLSWPTFQVRSIHNSSVSTVTSGSAALVAGEALVIDLDRSFSGSLVPTSESSPLNQLDHRDSLVLAVCLTPDILIWLEGWRVLGALSAFDVDGTPLPLGRFIGLQDPKNPGVPTPGFSGPAGASLTEKLGAQSSHLKVLFERENLRYEPEAGSSIYTDLAIKTGPSGAEFFGAELMTGISQPTHVLELQGRLYGLNPTRFYYFDPEIPTWTLCPGQPTSNSYTALSIVGTTLGALCTNGLVVSWDPVSETYITYTPLISTSVSSSLPFPTSRGVSYMSGGKGDFALQSSEYSLFTTLSGETIRFYKERNVLDKVQRVFGLSADAPETDLWSHHTLDTGYNLDVDALTGVPRSGSNGGFSRLLGLPVSDLSGPLTIDPQTRQDLIGKGLDLEAVQIGTDNVTFMVLEKEPVSGDHFLFRGGPGGGEFLTKITTSTFPFTPQTFLLDQTNISCYAIGIDSATSNVYISKGTGQNSDSWTWASYIVPGVQGTGVEATMDMDGYIYIFVSDPGASFKPTLIRFKDGVFSTLGTFTGGTNCFQYSYGTDAQMGFPVNDNNLVLMLVKDKSRAGAPTLFMYNKGTLTLSTDSTLIDTTLVDKVVGGFYNSTFKSFHWFAQTTTSGRVSHLSFFPLSGTFFTTTIGNGGAFLPGYNLGDHNISLHRSASYSTCSHLPTMSPIPVWFKTRSEGLLRGDLTGSTSSITGSSWSVDRKQEQRPGGFSVSPVPSTYEPLVGANRGDIAGITIGSIAEPTLKPLENAYLGSTPTNPLLPYGGFWPLNGQRTLVKNPMAGLIIGKNAVTKKFEVCNTRTLALADGTLETTSALNLEDPGLRRVAESFVPAKNNNIISTKWKMALVTPGAAPATARIYSNSGGLPGTLLGTSNTVTLTSTVFFEHTFTFTTPIPVQAGTQYWVVIYFLFSAGAFKFKRSWGTGSSLYDNSGSWTSYSRDLSFSVQGNLDSVQSWVPQLWKAGSADTGDVVVPGLASMNTLGYDVAVSTDGTRVGIVYGSLIGNQVYFILYDPLNNVVLQNETTSSNTGSRPRITFDLNTSGAPRWLITFEDPVTNQVKFLIRDFTDSVGAWTIETVGLASQGYRPSKPIIVGTSVLVSATVSSPVGSLAVYKRSSGGIWTTVEVANPSSAGGFNQTCVAYYSSRVLIFGSYASASPAKIAYSGSFGNAGTWSYISSGTGYETWSRMFNVDAINRGQEIILAGELNNPNPPFTTKDILIGQWSSSGSCRRVSAFTPLPSLTATWKSNYEEFQLNGLSWGYSYAPTLFYGGYRTTPYSTDPHTSVRVFPTTNSIYTTGESVLGQGRGLTLDFNGTHEIQQYREIFTSPSDQDYIQGISSVSGILTSSSPPGLFPVGTSVGGQRFQMAWKSSPPLAPESLFYLSGTGLLSLQTGIPLAASARVWPILTGTQTGAGHLSWLGLEPPPGSTNLGYFGSSTVGGSNILRAKTITTLNFVGNHAFRETDQLGKAYVITGPLTFQIDESLVQTGSHLVLNFASTGSLVLDTNPSSLTYWSYLDFPTAGTSPLVLAQWQGQNGVQLARVLRSVRLTDARRERGAQPLSPDKWSYWFTPHMEAVRPVFLVDPTDTDKFLMRRVGRLSWGIQRGTQLGAIGQWLTLSGDTPGFGRFLFIAESQPTGESGLVGLLIGRFGGTYLGYNYLMDPYLGTGVPFDTLIIP